MSLFPWVVGQTAPAWALTAKDDAGNPVNITGATITLSIRRANAAASIAGGGTFNITNGAAGQFTYTPNGSEFAQPGQHDLQFKAVLSGGGIWYHDWLTGPVNAPI